MADMRISELTTAAGLHDGDLFETSQTDSISSSGYASYKTSLNAIAAFIAKQVLFSDDLQTISKNLIGAINEVFNAGTSVTVTNVLPATETTKRVATITVDGVEKDINADDTVKVITDLKTPKSATITNGIAQFECIEENLVKGLKVTMNPIQDLHGYSNPWVGGAGKNKLQNTMTSDTVSGVTYTVNSDGTVALSNTATAEAIRVSTFTLPAGSYIYSSGANETFQTYDTYLTSRATGTTIARGISGYESFSLSETTELNLGIRVRNGVNVNGVVIKPMVRLSTEPDATFAPYSNICPISGRTEASVKRTGVNQWDEVVEKGTINDTTGQNANDGLNQYTRSKNYIPVFEGKTYRFKTVSNGKVYYYDAEKTYISYSGISNGEVKTIPSGCAYIRFWVNYSGAYKHDMSVNYPSTDTGYHAYTAETKTHQYSETIYGGVDDFVNGGATSTRGMIDLGTLTWTKHSDEGRFYTRFRAEDNAKPSASSTVAGGLICSQYVDSAQTSLSNGKISIDANSIPYINIIDLTKSDLTAEQFKTAMDGVQLCYELATPTAISTSAEEITTVSGTNIISGTEPISECKYTELATVDDLIKIIGGQ